MIGISANQSRESFINDLIKELSLQAQSNDIRDTNRVNILIIF